MSSDDLSDASVTVVGGGFGGLSAACYLADAGADVTVLEKNEQMGGRASTLEREGFRFDMGPSWYLMPDVFERFFGSFGREPSDYYELEHLDPHYKIFFKDGDVVEMPNEPALAADVFEEYEENGAEKLRGYLDSSERNYELAMNNFIYEDRSRLRNWLDPSVLRAIPLGLQLLGSMEGYVHNRFESDKLRQILQYTLVFLGGSPKNTPALYNLMSHVDFNLGVYYPEGGMTGVADSIAEMARELGVETRTGVEVTGVRNSGRVLRTTEGEFRADATVCDADYAHFELDVLEEHQRTHGEEYWESRTYAPSAFLVYWGVEGDVDELEHHTLVLPTDWDQHFHNIFENPGWPMNPAYYLCVASESDDTVAPDGCSNLFTLVPIASGLEDNERIRERYKNKILDDMAENTGVDIRDRILVEEVFTVDDFASRYNSYKGTALGLAHTLRQTAFMRPSHRSSKVDSLYYTGSYTDPGIGVPMCLVSGEHTANTVKNEL
jgi:phytoene desaturase